MACISFQPTETCALAPVSPSRAKVIKNNPSLNYLIDFLSHNFIRLGLTRAKALQTVSRFPRETRRRYAAPKYKSFTLVLFSKHIDTLSLVFTILQESEPFFLPYY